MNDTRCIPCQIHGCVYDDKKKWLAPLHGPAETAKLWTPCRCICHASKIKYQVLETVEQ